MSQSNLSPIQGGDAFYRNRLLQILQAGIWTESYRFARQAALVWLAAFPGDLGILRWMAAILAAEGKITQSIKMLDKLLLADPEDGETLLALKELRDKAGVNSSNLLEKLHVLDCKDMENAPDWAQFLRNRRVKQLEPDQDALFEIAKYLPVVPDESLLAIEHVKLMRRFQDAQSLLTLALLYQKRWPDCILFRLAAAEAMMMLGQEAEAVNIIHRCVAGDAAGQVASRWWGEMNPYRALWPSDMCIHLPIPIPAQVKYWLGENWLPGYVPEDESPDHAESDFALENGAVENANTSLNAQRANIAEDPSTEERQVTTESDVVKNVPMPGSGLDNAFGRIARQMNQKAVAGSDGRYPIYVIFTSKENLTKKYGSGTMAVIDQELQRLAKAIRARTDWGCTVFYADDAASVGGFDLTPVSPSDPWKLKLSLVDLDKALSTKGQRIGAVAIIGGPDVIPFHRLPNPVDDVDPDVLSDNPYGTIDTNYFIPIWPVGRIPGEDGSDAGLLLQQIRLMVKYHQDVARKIQEEKRSSGSFINFWRAIIQRAVQAKAIETTFGYTASVWKRASVAVFRPIGVAGNLVISPPVTSDGFNGSRASSASLGYYNLHGLEDAPEWYGQRDINDPAGADYPVAVKPTNLSKNARAPQIVFSEACYGAHIVRKTGIGSIALRFLSIGAQGFVGSTCVSYGSVGLPLITADLLGNLFWRYLKDHFTIGDALLHAKIGLAREMTKRQGCLDGEDQKTLISFVLYGDPLLSYELNNSISKRVLRSKSILPIKLVCDRGAEIHPPGQSSNMPKINDELIRKVKEIAAPYLPGLEKAEVKISRTEVACDGTDHTCPTSQLKAKFVGDPINRKTVVICKQVEIAKHKVTAYVRVTLDENNNPIKMVISR